MKTLAELKKEDIIDLLQRCWMTHDGMWFFHCLQEFGIETANRLNKAAIQSLAPLEVGRIRDVLGLGEKKLESFQDIRDFLAPVSALFIPAFMNIRISFPEENVLRWEFAPSGCFAFKGIKRIGAIDRYECGVLYRLACWFDCLGLTYTVTPAIAGCRMRDDGTCCGEFRFHF